MTRPLIAIASRFSDSASALRFGADVTARALAEGVHAAGGEPLMMHPAPGSDAEVRDRLRWADGVLMPGGGDISPGFTGDDLHPTHYDTDEEQDAFDFAIGRIVLAQRRPVLAICRGLQVINVLRGGTLSVDMTEDGRREHRHLTHTVSVSPASRVGSIVGTSAEVSCYHHQALRTLGTGLVATAHAEDGTVEAAEMPEHPGWFVGVQWHPEDTHATDPTQAALFAAFIDASQSAKEHP